jgi:hypothetical protein
MLPAHLTESVNNLGEAASAMTEEIRADREQRAIEHEQLVARARKQNRRIMWLLVIVAVLVAALAGMAVVNRQTNAQSAEVIREIRSCTSEKGECYQRGQQRTGAAIKELLDGNLRNTVIVVSCAERTETEAELLACAEARLAQPSEAEEPPPSELGPEGEPIPDPEPQPAPTTE